MDFSTWLAFFVACWVIAISPGSGAVLSMSHGLTYGVRKTSATIAGLQLGLVLILLIAGAGVGSVLMASPWAFAAVKVIGACYLIYVGISQWRAPVAASGTATGDVVAQQADTLASSAAGTVTQPSEPVGAAPVPSESPLSARQRLLMGFLTNATNPKGIIFMVAVLPQFLTSTRSLPVQLCVLAITMVAVDLVVMHSYAAGASALRRWMRSARAQRLQNRVFGGLLIAVGMGLFFVQRTGGGS